MSSTKVVYQAPELSSCFSTYEYLSTAQTIVSIFAIIALCLFVLLPSGAKGPFFLTSLVRWRDFPRGVRCKKGTIRTLSSMKRKLLGCQLTQTYLFLRPRSSHIANPTCVMVVLYFCKYSVLSPLQALMRTKQRKGHPQ